MACIDVQIADPQTEAHMAIGTMQHLHALAYLLLGLDLEPTDALPRLWRVRENLSSAMANVDSTITRMEGLSPSEREDRRQLMLIREDLQDAVIRLNLTGSTFRQAFTLQMLRSILTDVLKHVDDLLSLGESAEGDGFRLDVS